MVSVDHPLYNALGLTGMLDAYQEAAGLDGLDGSFVFFDEIRYLSDWERHLKALVEARWLAWRQAEGAVVPAVVDFAIGEWGQALFEEATEIFFVSSAPPGDEEGAGAWEQLFTPWFVFDFVPDPRRRRRGEIGAPWPTTLLVLEYARVHANELSSNETRFLRAASEAPLSFAAVTAVVVGRSLDLKDILTREAYHVLERGASSSLEVGHIILTRVVADGDVAIMAGLGPYPLFPRDHNRVIDFRERFLKLRGPVDRATLKARAIGRRGRPLQAQTQNASGPATCTTSRGYSV
jgi:hypothetical protein